MTTSVMKRGEEETRTIYVVAGAQRATVASGKTAAEAMENLLEITSA
jgi:hypothetical protein